jgi:hypothetical protein
MGLKIPKVDGPMDRWIDATGFIHSTSKYSLRCMFIARKFLALPHIVRSRPAERSGRGSQGGKGLNFLGVCGGDGVYCVRRCEKNYVWPYERTSVLCTRIEAPVVGWVTRCGSGSFLGGLDTMDTRFNAAKPRIRGSQTCALRAVCCVLS